MSGYYKPTDSGHVIAGSCIISRSRRQWLDAVLWLMC